MRCIVVMLAVCLAALPLAPTVSLATDAGISIDRKNTVKQKAAARAVAEEKTDTVGVDRTRVKVKDTPRPPVPAKPVEEEGLSTLTKVGIGVGVAAVVGVGLALAGGGGGDSGPVLPTPDILVGKWTARATSHTDRRTYSGVYDLYTVGSHTYDIYITGDNVRKRGRGNWTLIEGTNTLRLENDTGSIYVGDFQNENFTTITMTNQADRWELVLTKQ